MDIYFLVLPNLMLLDFAGTAEVFRVANDYGGQYRMHFISPAPATHASLGVTLSDLEPLPENLPDAALIFITGATRCAVDYELPEAKLAAQWLKRSFRASHLLCTVCSGVFLAAETGLLDGRNCTSHHTLTERLAKEYPQLKVLENRIFVQDGPFYTSAGVTAGLDLALHLVSEFSGTVCAVQTARLLVIYFRRLGMDEQLSPWLRHRNHVHTVVHTAQDILVRDPARQWSMPALAEEVHTSSRNLARLFVRYAGISPSEYLQGLRIAVVRNLLAQTDVKMPLDRIAEASGFTSASHLRRVWKKYESTSLRDFSKSNRARTV